MKLIFFFIETSSHFNIHELPKTLQIQNKNYKLLCAILHLRRQQHFVSIFEIGNNKYIVDDLLPNVKMIDQKNPIDKKDLQYLKLNINSALYYVID